MPNKLRIFLTFFVLSLPIFWGVNASEKKLEDFFFSQLYIETPRVLTAQLSPLPEKTEAIEPLEIQARAAFSVKTNEEGVWQILYQKNIKERLPIASLTKLMTALVILENYQLDLPVTISEKAVAQEEELGQLKAGEILSVKDLLYIMLMESSNDAAYALSEVIGLENFVDIMNWQAKYLGLKNTHFSNPTGLDAQGNYSSAQDLVILTKILFKKPLLWEILQIPELNLYLTDGSFHHKLINTNELLNKIPNVFGGKTGWSPKALGCLLLVLENKQGDYLINIILGADDRFLEMEKLIQLTTNL